ncbi:MAG: hypothetical protein Q4D98_07665 [Planctomycetia bacterium]|nr:hypothetical protein [Planctomycetia bacterium]
MNEIDVYSYCPGGTGNKIKFCCANRLEDFKKIYRFMEASQFAACLKYIDGLLEKDPDRPCLLALRCGVLDAMPQKMDEYRETANRFYTLHPNNPIALVESAYTYMLSEYTRITSELETSPQKQTPEDTGSLQEKFRQLAVEVTRRLEKAFEDSNTVLYEQVLDKIGTFAESLLGMGFFEAATAWNTLLISLGPQSPYSQNAARMMQKFYMETSLPLCLRVGLSLRNAPADADWRAEFDAAVSVALQLHWTDAEKRFLKLAERPAVAACASLWYNLATLSEWHCDMNQACEYWAKCSECSDISFYDALAARVRIHFLNRFPLGDAIDVYTIRYSLKETDEVQKLLLSNPIFQQIRLTDRTDPAVLGVFELLDSPKLTTLEGLDADDIPVVTGLAFLRGRQTDREPVLEILNVLRSGVDYVREELDTLLKNSLASEPEVQPMRKISVSVDSIVRRIGIPRGTNVSQIQEIRDAHFRNVLLNHWIHFPLGVLGRKSVENAAKDPANRLPIEGVLAYLQYFVKREGLSTAPLAELREKLGLPPYPEVSAEEAGELSPLFYHELKADGLSEEALERILLKATLYSVQDLPEAFLENVAQNTTVNDLFRIRVMVLLIQRNVGTEKAEQWLREGRELCVRKNLPDDKFDIQEIQNAIVTGRLERVFRIIKHIRQDHKDNRELQEYIAGLEGYLYNLMQQTQGQAPTADTPPAQQTAPSGLWTPDQPQNNASPKAGGASGLWLPD